MRRIVANRPREYDSDDLEQLLLLTKFESEYYKPAGDVPDGDWGGWDLWDASWTVDDVRHATTDVNLRGVDLTDVEAAYKEATGKRVCLTMSDLDRQWHFPTWKKKSNWGW